MSHIRSIVLVAHLYNESKGIKFLKMKGGLSKLLTAQIIYFEGCGEGSD